MSRAWAVAPLWSPWTSSRTSCGHGRRARLFSARGLDGGTVARVVRRQGQVHDAGACSLLLRRGSGAAHQQPRAQRTRKDEATSRANTAANDNAYSAILQREDADNLLGFSINKTLSKAAVRAFAANLKRLVPRILPAQELFRLAADYMRQKFFLRAERLKMSVNLKTGVDHFCLHSGGVAVIEAVKKNFGLDEVDVEPSRMTLHRWGNTSASSVWYVLSYMEAKGRLKRGDRVLMVTFGSGFKCNSCMWDVTGDMADKGALAECIDEYPLESTANASVDKYGWINDVDDESALF